MLFGPRGSIHTIVLVLVVIVGFGIALGWPQYKKHQMIGIAQQALDLGKALAFAEATYQSPAQAAAGVTSTALIRRISPNWI